MKPFETKLWLSSPTMHGDELPVAQMVSTYHPAGEHGSEEKGEAYENQINNIS